MTGRDSGFEKLVNDSMKKYWVLTVVELKTISILHEVNQRYLRQVVTSTIDH
jgi:hypothetical protein